MALRRRDNERKHRQEESFLAIVLGQSSVSSAKVQRLARVRWVGQYRRWQRSSRMSSRRSLKLVAGEDEVAERRKTCARAKTCRWVTNVVSPVVQLPLLVRWLCHVVQQGLGVVRLWRRLDFGRAHITSHPLDSHQTIVRFKCNNTINFCSYLNLLVSPRVQHMNYFRLRVF